MRLRFENLALVDDLSRAKDEAEAASRTKSRFLANLSHELRTHVALILDPTRRILASPACGPRTRRDLETVERNAEALLKNVTDLLDVAKLETGTVELERTPSISSRSCAGRRRCSRSWRASTTSTWPSTRRRRCGSSGMPESSNGSC
jgi:signal transduction histidine kinase